MDELFLRIVAEAMRDDACRAQYCITGHLGISDVTFIRVKCPRPFMEIFKLVGPLIMISFAVDNVEQSGQPNYHQRTLTPAQLRQKLVGGFAVQEVCCIGRTQLLDFKVRPRVDLPREVKDPWTMHMMFTQLRISCRLNPAKLNPAAQP